MIPWQVLSENLKTNEALRRAAAEQVLGWRPHLTSHETVVGWFENQEPSKTGRFHLTAQWLPDINRNDLARVFAAARKHPRAGPGTPFSWHEADVWADAIDYPRSALCALLTMLGIEPAKDLWDNAIV